MHVVYTMSKEVREDEVEHMGINTDGNMGVILLYYAGRISKYAFIVFSVRYWNECGGVISDGDSREDSECGSR